MKKTLKKALSIVLAVFTVLTLSLTAFAAISVDEAKTIALNDAGFTAAQVKFLKAELDDGKFEVDFSKDGISYDYNISKDGAIVGYGIDYNKTSFGAKNIDANAAKAAAFAAVGVKEADAKSVRAEYDREDNDYEISFTAGDKKYEVQVSAVDGSILEYDWEKTAGGTSTNAFIEFFRKIIEFFRNLFNR